MKHIFAQILSLRASGHVKRWHTVRTITQQTVAEHSGQAVTLLLTLHANPSLNLIKTMLWHDSSERIVGDVPAPIRRAFPSFAQTYEELELVSAMEHHPCAIVDLTPEEKIWLKTIDVLELWLHVREEMKLGNSVFGTIFSRATNYLMDNASTPAVVREFMLWFAAEGDKEVFV